MNDSSVAWKGMSSITGHKHKQSVNTDVSKHFVNELNDFYSRFDAIDYKDEQSSLSAMLNNERNILKLFLKKLMYIIYFVMSKLTKHVVQIILAIRS